jgi:hypothetical protein
LEGSEGGRIRVNGLSTKQPNRGELNPNPILVGDIINSNADLYIGAAQLDPPGNYGFSDSFDDPFPEATEQALMEGGIAEVIIYREALTPAEVKIVEHYLGVKYGIEFEEPLYYTNSEYKYDVIGIGTADGIQIHSFGKAGAFSLEAVTETFESAEEYLFAGHDNLPIELSNEGFSEDNILGWNRSWWMEKNGEISAKIFFDFIEAGMRMESVSDYRFAYRSSMDETFQLLDLPARKQLRSLYFEIPSNQLQNGIYTLAYLEESTNVNSINISDNIDIYPNPADTKYSTHL